MYEYLLTKGISPDRSREDTESTEQWGTVMFALPRTHILLG